MRDGAGKMAAAELPRGVATRWKSATDLAKLPIDHSVGVVAERGGAKAAAKRLRAFCARDLDRYDEARNDPDANAGSGLSGYLHFGHLSAHEVFWTLAAREGWKEFGPQRGGKRDGFWGMSPSAEKFLDEVVTWRELGYARGVSGARRVGLARPSLAALAAVPWVASPVENSCGRALERLARQHGFPPRRAHVCLEFPAVLALLAAGQGAAIVPLLALVEAPARAVAVTGIRGVGFRWVAAVHRATGPDPEPVVRVVIDGLRQVAAERAGRR